MRGFERVHRFESDVTAVDDRLSGGSPVEDPDSNTGSRSCKKGHRVDRCDVVIIPTESNTNRRDPRGVAGAAQSSDQI